MEWVWGGSPRFRGNGYARLVAWEGAGQRGKVITGVVHLGMGGNVGQRPQRESHYPGQPSNQGLPINPTKRVLRGFKGGNGQSAPNVVPTGPLPTSNQGLADPALLLPLLQSLGLPEEVLEAVRAKVATPNAPKKIFSGKTAFVDFEPRLTSLISKFCG